jgi:hypothetical protein
MKRQLNRRALLRGLGGATLALPFLEYFQPRRAAAQTEAENSRLILCYAGQAMGADGDGSRHRFRPEREGRLVEMSLPLSLQPLGGRELWPGSYRHPRHGSFVEPVRNWPGEVPDVRDRVTVVTGLHIPLTGPASANSYHHRGTVSPALSGTSSHDNSPRCNGPTADVLFEEHFGSPPALRCLVQAGNYGNGGAFDDVLSWRRNAAGGMDAIAAQVSPRAMYHALFEGFVPRSETPDAEAARALRRRRGVLDLVLPAAQDLNARLGMGDRQRLQAHLDGLSTLQSRLSTLDSADRSAACVAASDPGEDPRYAGGSGGDGGGFNEGQGWSGEEKRAEAFIDMLVLALACDMTRSATLMFSYHQSFLNGEPPTGLRGDQHQIGHGGPVERANGSGNDSVALCHHYPVRYFGYLVGKLAGVQVGPDRTLLDEVGCGLFFEAGHGRYEGNWNAHSGDEMACLIAGGAGGLVQGRHVRLEGEHPAKVVASLLGAVGCDPVLGDIRGAHARLFA